MAMHRREMLKTVAIGGIGIAGGVGASKLILLADTPKPGLPPAAFPGQALSPQPAEPSALDTMTELRMVAVDKDLVEVVKGLQSQYQALLEEYGRTKIRIANLNMDVSIEVPQPLNNIELKLTT